MRKLFTIGLGVVLLATPVRAQTLSLNTAPGIRTLYGCLAGVSCHSEASTAMTA